MKEEKELVGEVFSIEISKIKANPNQPRKVFCEESILKLASSIKQFGIMQPLSIRRLDGEYELISGERRLRAAKELGMRCVPCIISEATEQKSAEMAIIENLIRQDLNAFEEAEAIEVLIDTYHLTQEQVAKKLSSSQSYIANKLRLLRLSQEEREKIIAAKLSERHARALLRIYDDELRKRVLDTIISQELNVAKTEELVEKAISKEPPNENKKRTFKSIDSFYEAISRAITAVEGSGFKIKSRKIENDNYTELTIIVPKEQEETIAI